MANKQEIMIVDEQSLRDKIYIIRGQQVMLDFDLAAIYGYETKNFNRQVKNNIERFEGDDFMFQLTDEETAELSRCNNFTLNRSTGRGSNIKYNPHAFTEQGIYLLMTVLKGDLAVAQSRKLVRLFKSMKDYLIENQALIPQKAYIALAEKVEEHSRDIKEIKENMVTKADLSDFMRLFDSSVSAEEILILDGEPLKADVAYQKIYRKAKKSIIVIDNYIGVKTLQHLATAKRGVAITIISDNKSRPPLHQSEYSDFKTENANREITFIKAENRAHDRFIVLDSGNKDMKVYFCGSSSKDSGRGITTIMRVSDTSEYRPLVKSLMENPTLNLR